jgi:(1->4)-alpha-D-glucan 1-alpha-D-glucosylmutase
LNLVDPDNRRPVDYALRRQMLAEIKKQSARTRRDSTSFIASLLKKSDSGAIKLFLIWRALNFRREHRELFDNGDYVPLSASGKKAQHVCAFARTLGQKAIIVVAPRLVFGLTNGTERLPMGREIWGETRLPIPSEFAAQEFRNVFTNEILAPEPDDATRELDLASVLSTFPVALLT